MARRFLGILADICINFAVPLLIYDRVSPQAGDVAALVASSVPPLLWSIAQLVYRRRIDALSMLVLAGIALSLLALLGGGSARFLLLRENLVSAVIGLAFLGSAVIGRPLIYQLAHARLVRSSPDKVSAFEARRDTPRFRRVMTVMTVVWGCSLLSAAAAASALVFALNIHDYMIVSPFITYGCMAVLGLWTVWYRRLVRRSESGV
ncbi:VC0807 family protein [Rhizobium sp. NFR03]|uniref:VC0807 family protein n=1 Tax=Rhizobium sp. NFR03 TaxID=1566263 RepID=UPI0008C5D4E3|nr:VC0807 family protein [Rhizobium sp. NFR03]SER48953.1 hypothetical protein SAMN03159406_00220 [Rhizobium sp. NFR03]